MNHAHNFCGVFFWTRANISAKSLFHVTNHAQVKLWIIQRLMQWHRSLTIIVDAETDGLIFLCCVTIQMKTWNETSRCVEHVGETKNVTCMIEQCSFDVSMCLCGILSNNVWGAEWCQTLMEGLTQWWKRGRKSCYHCRLWLNNHLPLKDAD